MNKVLIINPIKREDIELLNKFDEENNVVTSKEIHTKNTTMSEKEYRELQRKSNEIEQQLAIEQNGTISEICYISGVKDIKQCTLSFESKNKSVSKKILKAGINYAFNTIGMETIFINVDTDNQKLIKLLDNEGFINIGEVKGKNTFLKEKEIIEIGSMKSEHNKKY